MSTRDAETPGEAPEPLDHGRRDQHRPHAPTEAAHRWVAHGSEHDHGQIDDRDHEDAAAHFHGHGPDGDGRSHAHPGSVLRLVSSLFRRHSHVGADAVDSTLEASAEGMRALKLSLAGLGITALVQVLIFAVSGSVALLADTIHNLADALTAVPLAAAFLLGRRPPNRRYTYGYGRSEDLAGIFIVATIVASSAVAAWESINRLMHAHRVHHIGWVIGAGIVGFVGNEAVAQYRVRVGRRIGSAALEADGQHARTDGFTSLAVVVGGVGVVLGWQLADAVVGLLVTAAILAVVRTAARDIYRRLMDAVDPALVEQVTTILAGVDGIEAVEAVRIRWIGRELHAEAEVVSDGAFSLTEAHTVAEHAHHHLLHEVPRLAQVTIHTSPRAGDGADPHSLTAHHRHGLLPSNRPKDV